MGPLQEKLTQVEADYAQLQSDHEDLKLKFESLGKDSANQQMEKMDEHSKALEALKAKHEGLYKEYEQTNRAW